ncbi:MAG: hypothetical protein Kow0031_05790 [Anaerolineae bacterium]
MNRGESSQPVVLVVDDDSHLRMMMQVYLQQLGYPVLCAENGAHGLAVYREHRAEIGIVLLDLVMPKMNGLELFYALKRLNPQVNCIMISGNEPTAAVREALSAGMIAFLQKPIPLPVLAAHLKAVATETETQAR